ncbi:MAG: flagellar basal body-associated FliL family protein [Bdellovibrionales bacterium]|nr:flagellar basal body-associated FliL family protein [Bdellovibrionales bacterium]NQZ19206.1 flagellar basal body-associated FliL family protein [Bdellovibrionales bacterium]
MAEEIEGAPAPAKKKLNFKQLLFMVFLGLNGVAMVAGVYLTYLGTIGTTKESVREAQAKEILYNEEVFEGRPIVYNLDPFTVNLADEDERVVQVKVALEMIDENGFEEVVSMGAHARDAIVHILNGKEFGDLQTIQGKLFLKDEITVALNKQLKRSFIKDVYFSRFVLQ